MTWEEWEARNNWIDEMLDKTIAEGRTGNKSINRLFNEIEQSNISVGIRDKVRMEDEGE